MGVKIDKELLKKRAEHNDGELSTLKEIALHQFDLEKIENLDIYCRHLEILLLQNNQIGKIENLHKLKELKYLNLALNNIQKIENLNRCESLQKLDLTLNFVENLLDVEHLKENEDLREVYLIGNPCAQEEGYRAFVICALPQLRMLDGKEIEKSDRLVAMKEFNAIRQQLIEKQGSLATKEPSKVPVTDSLTPEDIEKRREEFQHELTSHTPESRLKIARDLEIMRNGPKTAPKEEKKPIPLYGKNGRVLQRNEGKWEFHIFEQDDSVILTVETSKFLDSSLLEVEVHADWLKVTIKGKVLQLRLECPVVENEAVCERSRSSGQLVITMLKATSKGKDIEKLIQETKQTNAQTTTKNFNDLMKQKEQLPAKRDRRQERFLDSLANLEIKEIHQKSIERVEEPFEDDPNVPPLE